jgi:lysozyme
MIDEGVRIGAELCRRFEGFYPRPYLCPAGIPTIGYGIIRYSNGIAVTLRDAPITRERAEELLMHHIRADVLPPVLRLCPQIDTPGRLGALVSWTYNLGSGNLAASTLRRRINARAWQDVPDQLRRWNRGGGVVLRGLVRRREAEAALI